MRTKKNYFCKQKLFHKKCLSEYKLRFVIEKKLGTISILLRKSFAVTIKKMFVVYFP